MAVHDWEIPLMVLHGADQRLGRHLQKPPIEITGQRHRPFHQRRHLVEQFRLDDRLPPQLGGHRLGLGADRRAALGEVGDNPTGVGQLPDVIGRSLQADRLGMVEAMAARLPARRDPHQHGGNDLVAEQQNEPVHRPHEFIVAIAPAHPLGDRQSGEGGFDQTGDEIGGRRTRFGADVDQPDALIGFLALQFGDRDTAGPGKAFGGLGRVTGRIEGGAQRGTTPFHPAVGLALRQVLDQQRQPAGGGEMMQGGVGPTGFFQSLAEALLESQRQRG